MKLRETTIGLEAKFHFRNYAPLALMQFRTESRFTLFPELL